MRGFRMAGVTTLMVALVVMLSVADLAAQRGGRGGGERREITDEQRAQWRERMEERRTEREEELREEMGASTDEWKVIQPLLRAVSDKQTEVRVARMSGMGGRRGGGRRGGGMFGEPMAEAQSLQKVLENKDAKAADIKKALDAYRAAVKKLAGELDKAQDALSKVLTQRQVAMLVLRGTLD